MAMTEELLRLCARHAGAKHFYLGDQMPPQKKQNAYEGLQIPGEETLVAFVDSTLLGDCKTGLAIAASGVYFNNSGLAQIKQMHLPWDELAELELTPSRMGAIDFGGNTLFELAGSQFKRNDLLELLLEAQQVAGQGVAAAGNVAQTQDTTAGGTMAPPPLPPVPEQWMVAVGGQSFGPYDRATLEGLIFSQQIDPAQSLAWKQGLPNWVPFAEVPELASLGQKQTQEMTPPPLVAGGAGEDTYSAPQSEGQNARPSGFSGAGYQTQGNESGYSSAGYQPQMEEKLQGSSARMDFSGVEPYNWVTPPSEPNRPSPYFESPRERVHTGLYGETQARPASQHLLENAPSSSSPQGMPGRMEPRGGSTFLGGGEFNRSPYERGDAPYQSAPHKSTPYQNGRTPMGEPTYRPPTGPMTHNPTPARMQEPLHHDDDVHPPHTVIRDEPGQVTRRPAGRQVDAVDERLDLNRATVDELLGLPDISLPQAEQIVAERERRQGFSALEQIGRLLDLKPHQLERLRAETTLLPYGKSASPGAAGPNAGDRRVDF